MDDFETHYEHRNWGRKSYTYECFFDSNKNFVGGVVKDNNGETFIITVTDKEPSSVYGFEMPDFNDDAIFREIVAILEKKKQKTTLL